MKHFIVKALFLLLIVNSSYAQDFTKIVKPKLYPRWAIITPGGTSFHDKKFIRGALFAASEIGAVGLGIAYKDQLESNSSTPYHNYPLLLGMQIYTYDKCDVFRNIMELNKYYRPGFKYDDIETNKLLIQPFKPENIFTPITGGFVLVALVELYFEGKNAKHSFNDVNQMYLLNHYADRNQALAALGAVSLGASMGAGITEEYTMRNMIMPLWDYKYGQKKGLWYSSIFFGAMHFPNVLFADKPDYKMALLQVAEATLAGYFLGKDVQNRGYKIGPAIAAHTWYDFTLMLGSFLVNPKENVFGVNVTFKIK